MSQRIVFEVSAATGGGGGVLRVPITKSLLSYAQAARQKYMTYLNQKSEKGSNCSKPSCQAQLGGRCS